jgi:hypothetical protein
MKKEDVSKKVDLMLGKLEKQVGKYGEGHFPMEKEITFFDRDGRSYIKVKITDRFGNRNWYNCGYIAEGKYSSKCKFGDYYRVMSLFRPNYERLVMDFGLVPLDEEDRIKVEHEAMLYQQVQEIKAAEKEGRKPRKVVNYVNGEFVYDGIYEKDW